MYVWLSVSVCVHGFVLFSDSRLGLFMVFFCVTRVHAVCVHVSVSVSVSVPVLMCMIRVYVTLYANMYGLLIMSFFGMFTCVTCAYVCCIMFACLTCAICVYASYKTQTQTQTQKYNLSVYTLICIIREWCACLCLCTFVAYMLSVRMLHVQGIYVHGYVCIHEEI